MLSDEEEIYLQYEVDLAKSFSEEKYNETIEIAEKYLADLNKSTNDNFDNYWVADKMLSQCYLHLGDTKKALEYIHNAMNYVYLMPESLPKWEGYKGFTDWQLGRCYKYNDNNTAFVILNTAYAELLHMKNYECCGKILIDICEIEDNIKKLVNNIIKINKLDLTNDDKNTILTIIYNRLDVLCEDDNNKLLLAQNIHNINDKKIYYILRNKVLCIA